MTALNEQMTLAQIVLDHSECAGVLQRHRIDYCCKGEQSLAEACGQRGADARQVLFELDRAVAERTSPPDPDPRKLSTEALLEHLVQRHHRTLRDGLPMLVALSKKVARVHGHHDGRLEDLRALVEELADTFVPHLDEEEQVLFPALRKASGGGPLLPELDVAGELSTMREDHLEVGELLALIRAAANDFALPDFACTSFRTLFRELEHLEADTFAHVHLENHVLMPRFAA